MILTVASLLFLETRKLHLRISCVVCILMSTYDSIADSNYIYGLHSKLKFDFLGPLQVHNVQIYISNFHPLVCNIVQIGKAGW